jgi:hypothetical protein
MTIINNPTIGNILASLFCIVIYSYHIYKEYYIHHNEILYLYREYFSCLYEDEISNYSFTHCLFGI